MILYPEDEEEEWEEIELTPPAPQPPKRWTYMAPVLEALKKKPEIEPSEEEGDEEEEEEEEKVLSKGLALKVSTPAFTVELSIAGKKPEKELLNETEVFFERILKIGRKYHIL